MGFENFFKKDILEFINLNKPRFKIKDVTF